MPGFGPRGPLQHDPANDTALMGVLTGHLLRSRLTGEEKTAWMFVAGNSCSSQVRIVDMVPINKALWTSSYVIFMAGWANVCLAMFYWLIDVKGYRTSATPFVIYGMNAITVFVLSGLITEDHGPHPLDGEESEQKYSVWSYLYQTLYVPLGSPMNTSLMLRDLVHLDDVPGGLVHVEAQVVPEGLTQHRFGIMLRIVIVIGLVMGMSLQSMNAQENAALLKEIQRLEQQYGGHLGVMAKNLRTGEVVQIAIQRNSSRRPASSSIR